MKLDFNPYHAKSLFWLWKALAGLGLWKYDGLTCREPAYWPQARVLYPEGLWSRKMAIGSARDYADMHKGTIHHPQDRAARVNARRGLA